VEGFAGLGSALNGWQFQSAASQDSSQEMQMFLSSACLWVLSQDLTNILALWFFLTSSITPPGKPFTVVSTVL